MRFTAVNMITYSGLIYSTSLTPLVYRVMNGMRKAASTVWHMNDIIYSTVSYSSYTLKNLSLAVWKSWPSLKLIAPTNICTILSKFEKNSMYMTYTLAYLVPRMMDMMTVSVFLKMTCEIWWTSTEPFWERALRSGLSLQLTHG